MNHKQYIKFHDKFTQENKFEFSHGIYMARDFVRNRIKLDNIKYFISLIKNESEIFEVLEYLKNKNIESITTCNAIDFLKGKIIKI